MEVPKNMLPDPQPEEVVEETPTPEQEVTDEPQEQEQPKPPKGYVPHEALLEERKKRKQAEVEAAEAEARLNSLSSSEPDEVDTSALEDRLAKLERATIYATYPNLTDKKDEFEAFIEENPHYPLDSAAKIFMAENEMFEKPKRKGLERPTSGSKTPPKTGYSMEEIKDLRENQPRKYIELLKSGKITFDGSSLG